MGGGMPLTSDGQVIAGVGVSGGTTEQDVAIVEAAVVNPNPVGPTGPSAARVPVGYTEQKARVGDVVINYVRGGNGPTLVLLHGYPQTWYEWRELLPEFAKQYTVIAPDLRGAGASDAPADGYDKKTMAADIHGLLTQLGLADGIRLIGHDIGTMVAYAYAAAHPSEVTRLVLSESPLPDEGLYQFPSLTSAGPGFWNFGFFSNINGLPEDIIAGHEEIWVARFIDTLAVHKDAIGPAQVREYASDLCDPAHLRAGFEWFRAFPKDLKDNAEYIKTRLPMPVLAVGAQGSLGDLVPNQIRRYATDMTGIVIEDCGHWIYQEQPQQILERLRQFLR
jgi:pimeloyl-ACP methyl ester carboxylesterase